ncbi:hypothetical protein TNCV_56561 [Trichonephila clavipes]|nr:hypothetical protein TNCV_56561 [Trichonephila clavipes]
MCFRLPPIPVTTARLETYNVYPNIGALGARDGIRGDRRCRKRDNSSKEPSPIERKKDKISEDDEDGWDERGWIYKGSERVRRKIGILEAAVLKPLAAIKIAILEVLLKSPRSDGDGRFGGCCLRSLPRNEREKPRSLRNQDLEPVNSPDSVGNTESEFRPYCR